MNEHVVNSVYSPVFVFVALSATACQSNVPVQAGESDNRNVEAERQTRSLLPLPAFAYAATAPGKTVSVADIAERVLPSIVNIASSKRIQAELPELPFSDPFFEHFFGFPFRNLPPPELQRGLGSGVIVAEDIILTNNHVVEGADELKVTMGDKRELQAEVAGTDPKSDLAVLRIKGKPSGLKPLEFGDSQRLRLGDVVLAVGNPFGVGQTVTMGIVSAKGRANVGIVDYEDFIQTDAAINPGNSGGALVDMQGKLVGIPTAILSRSGGYMGVGFAIPTEMVRPIMQSLLTTGKVVRGWLGVVIQDIDSDLARAMKLPSTSGVLVADISPDGPAAKAGLHRGDVITAVDGKPVDSTGRLRNLIAAAGAHRKINLDIVRNGKQQSVQVELAVMPRERAALGSREPTTSSTAGGIAVAPLGAEVRRRFDIPSSVSEGVVVTQIDPSSEGAKAGLRPGDVVLEVNRTRVTSPERFTKLWQEAKGTTLLLISRAGHTLFLAAKR